MHDARTVGIVSLSFRQLNSAVHDAHAAVAEVGGDGVRTDGRIRCQGHRRSGWSVLPLKLFESGQSLDRHAGLLFGEP